MNWPHDRTAERAVIGNSLTSADWHWRARHHVAPADFYFTEHQVIFEALDALDDIGPLTPLIADGWEPWVPLWPLTPPSSLSVRCAAVWVLGPYGAPLAALRRLAQCASGLVEADAASVRARADERREIQALQARIAELAGVGR